MANQRHAVGRDEADPKNENSLEEGRCGRDFEGIARRRNAAERASYSRQLSKKVARGRRRVDVSEHAQFIHDGRRQSHRIEARDNPT